MKKQKLDVKTPKSQLRIGFDSLERSIDDGDLGVYRYWHKGSYRKFRTVERRPTTIDNVFGALITLIGISKNSNIYYEAFERPDGACFFLGESKTQAVDQSQRNRDAIYQGRFN